MKMIPDPIGGAPAVAQGLWHFALMAFTLAAAGGGHIRK